MEDSAYPRIMGDAEPELSCPPCSPRKHLALDVGGEAKRFPGGDGRYQLFPDIFVAGIATRVGERVVVVASASGE